MYDNEFFVVDMASCSSTGEIINSLSIALETLNHSGKKIVLKLNDNYLNQSQLLSIQSLITSYGCTLDTVETVNQDTWTVAENMNIFVQKPIEKRVDTRFPEDTKFKPFEMNTNPDNSISLKDINGLHFEADLDAIKNQQDSINIASDFEKAGINPQDNFEQIENQINSHYAKPNEILNTVNDFSPVDSFKLNNASDFSSDTKFKTELQQTKDTSVAMLENTDENTGKNSISVYKKAYDDDILAQSDWEDVDFYETPTNDPVVSDTKTTTYINQTLRSGQILESDGNVVVIGDCHPGSEIRANGDITVWGVLSGIAHAGYKGNNLAKIRALKVNAIQLRIGNCYSRRPDDTNIPYIIKTSVFTPEEARVVDGEIMLFKINQN